MWSSDLAGDEDVSPDTEGAAADLGSAFALPVLLGPEVIAVLAFFLPHPHGTDHGTHSRSADVWLGLRREFPINGHF